MAINPEKSEKLATTLGLSSTKRYNRPNSLSLEHSRNHHKQKETLMTTAENAGNKNHPPVKIGNRLPDKIEKNVKLHKNKRNNEVFVYPEVINPADLNLNAANMRQLFEEEFRKLEELGGEFNEIIEMLEEVGDVIEWRRHGGGFEMTKDMEKLLHDPERIETLMIINENLPFISYLKASTEFCEAFDDDGKRICCAGINLQTIVNIFTGIDGLRRSSRHYAVNPSKIAFVELDDQNRTIHFIKEIPDIPLDALYIEQFEEFIR